MNSLHIDEGWRFRQIATGWGASLVLHACLLLVAMIMAPRMTLVIEQKPFQWDVALVDAPREVVQEAAPVQEVPAPPQPKASRQPTKVVAPTPQIVTRQVETREVPKLVERNAEPIQHMEEPQVQRTVEPVQRIEPVKEVVQAATNQVEPQPIKKPDPVVQEAPLVTEATPVTEQALAYQAPAAVEKNEVPVPATEPVVQTRELPQVVTNQPVMESRPEPVIAESSPMPKERVPLESPPAVAKADQPSEPVSAPPAPGVPDEAVQQQPAPAQQEEHQVVARAVPPRPTPSKADFAWLAESLHRRIIELRHYPKTARLNGWEGKVVLRVTLKRDGHLEDVQIMKSSGYEALDDAAMEAVRRACPLHMKQEVATPTVVVQVPINYSLNR
jgi:protein TonB